MRHIHTFLYNIHLVISSVALLKVYNDSFDDQLTDLRKFGVDYGNQSSVHMSEGRRGCLSSHNGASQQSPVMDISSCSQP